MIKNNKNICYLKECLENLIRFVKYKKLNLKNWIGIEMNYLLLYYF